MQLRHAADRRTLLWALVLFPLIPLVEYARPHTLPWLLPINLYLAYCAGVLTHNHNHRPVFVDRTLNSVYSVWLSVFYGAPIFTWIPTHNRNHHRHTNGALDDTRTWRYSNENTLLAALTYPFVSTRFQLPAVRDYLGDARRKQPERFRWMAAQIAGLAVAHATLLTAAMAWHGAWRGIGTYALAFGLPALFAPWAMMFTNYVQHVHCNPASPHNHSRNFVDSRVNWFVFDAGYHTVHHDAPGVHWSHNRKRHELRAKDIAPELNEHSIFSFCVKNYVLGPFIDRFRSRPLDSDGASRKSPEGAQVSSRSFIASASA